MPTTSSRSASTTTSINSTAPRSVRRRRPRPPDVPEELVRDRLGAVLVARLNRPDARNALTPELIRAIGAAIVDAEADPDIRAVVLIGTGDRAFCAGMDLRAFAAGGPAGLGGGRARPGVLRLAEGGRRGPPG